MGGGASGGASGGVASGGSAGTGGNAGNGGSAGTGGTAGSTGGGTTVNSNLPIVFEQSGVPALSLLSSNLQQKEHIAPDTFKQWFAEVVNSSDGLVCFAEVTITFQTSLGSTLLELHSFADADAYQSSLPGLPVPCIPPRKTAGFYTNDISLGIVLADIRKAKVVFRNLSGTYTPHPARPIVESAIVSADSRLGAGYWSVSGMVRAEKTVRTLIMTVFPRSPSSGLLLDQTNAIHSDALLAGEGWAYETLGYKGERYTSYLQTIDFIDESSSAYWLGANSEVTIRESERRAAFVREREARRERARKTP